MTMLRRPVPARSLLIASGGRVRSRPPLVSVQDEQGRLTPEFLATLNPRPRDRYGPRPENGGSGTDSPGRWLTVAMVALGVLAAAAAVVSFAAQYRMVHAAKGTA